MGASNPHFALQLRERIRKLIQGLPPDHPARIEGEPEIARLDRLAYAGGESADTRLRTGWIHCPAWPSRDRALWCRIRADGAAR